MKRTPTQLARQYTTVTIDANVWHKAFPRYLIASMHQEGVCDVQWSDLIWKECEDSLQKPNPGLSKKKVNSIYREIRQALGVEHFLDDSYHGDIMDEMFKGVTEDVVPDADDIQVMYLSMLTDSEYLVTYDMSHFTREASNIYGFKAVSLDDFLCAMMSVYPKKFNIAIVNTIASMQKKNETTEKIVERLGLPEDGENGGYGCPVVSSRLMRRLKSIEKAVRVERATRKQMRLF